MPIIPHQWYLAFFSKRRPRSKEAKDFWLIFFPFPFSSSLNFRPSQADFRASFSGFFAIIAPFYVYIEQTRDVSDIIKQRSLFPKMWTTSVSYHISLVLRRDIVYGPTIRLLYFVAHLQSSLQTFCLFFVYLPLGDFPIPTSESHKIFLLWHHFHKR